MNAKNRIVAWLLAVVMMLTVLPISSGVAAEDVSGGYGRGILAQMENADALLYAYDVLVEELDDTPAKISIAHSTHKITWDELCTVYDLVLNDHPEVFWHGTSYSGTLADGYASALKPSYIMTGTELEAAKAALEAEVVRLTADLEGKSDYEKSILLHDRLAAKSQYVLQGYHQTAYGALVQGTAVCAGYSRAYQLLMQRVGIPTWFVIGRSINPSGQEVSHAWNMVQLDGEWCYTDVTWDDQPRYTFYAYLNMNSQQAAEGHTPTKYTEYLPVSTDTSHNYFVRNNLRMARLSVGAVTDVIRDYYPARVYVTGDKNTFIEDYRTYLLDICDALNAPEGAVSYGYASVGREVILQLSVPHTCDYVRQTVDATCSTDGYTVEECSYEFCHNERNRTVIPATGEHIYDNGCDLDCNDCGATRDVAGHEYFTSILTPATCGAEGLRVDTCRICLDTYTTVIPATGDHSFTDPCDTDCNFCGFTRQVAGHTYEVTVTEPTCHTAGVKTHICVSCGDTYTEAIPATGEHLYDNDCDAECNTCGAVRVAPHVYDNDDDIDCNACGAARPAHLPGDITGDGAVNLQDLAMLMRHLNGWDAEIDQDAVDVNGDGMVNNRDYALLQRYLNGWKVTLA